jgi:hypothetical protein
VASFVTGSFVHLRQIAQILSFLYNLPNTKIDL